MRTKFFCITVLSIGLFGIAAANGESCADWIKGDDETTYKVLQQGIVDKAQIPLKA